MPPTPGKRYWRFGGCITYLYLFVFAFAYSNVDLSISVIKLIDIRLLEVNSCRLSMIEPVILISTCREPMHLDTVRPMIQREMVSLARLTQSATGVDSSASP